MKVYIYSERVVGEVQTLMSYGAIVYYSVGGIEFRELLAAEDYEELDEVEESE